MALFNKKKLSLDEILNGIDNLSEEEKERVKAKMEDLYKAEDEREIDKIEENKGDGEVADEKGEEVSEASEEIGKDVDEVEEEIAEDKGESMEELKENETEKIEEPKVEEKNHAEVDQGIIQRLTALEEKLAEFNELKELMENFTKKQADSFGYKGAIPGAKKDINDMSASELKQKMLNGEI